MLEFKVENQIIKRTDSFLPIADSRNYLRAEFKTSDEWQGSITAVFGYGGCFYRVLLDGNNCCTVPWEVIKAPHFTVSLFCGEEKLITSNTVQVTVEPSGMKDGAQPTEPTPEIWQQYMLRMQENIENAVPYIGENGNWYFYNAEFGEYKDSGILAAPEKGVDYWTEADKAEIKADVAPFIVNVKVNKADGTITVDKTESLIRSAYRKGETVLAYVEYSAGEGMISYGKDIDILTLVTDGFDGSSYKMSFASTKRTGTDTYQATYLWFEGAIISFDTGETTEIWKIKTATLTSKEYVDSRIDTIKPFTINVTSDIEGTFTVDKTYDEMVMAYEEGKELVVKIHYLEGQYCRILRLESFSNGEFCFVVGHDGQFGYEYVLVDVSGVSFKKYALVQDMSELQMADAPPSSLAVAQYVDTQIGDIETVLDNIITKYGLGGDIV